MRSSSCSLVSWLPTRERRSPSSLDSLDTSGSDLSSNLILQLEIHLEVEKSQDRVGIKEQVLVCTSFGSSLSEIKLAQFGKTGF